MNNQTTTMRQEDVLNNSIQDGVPGIDSRNVVSQPVSTKRSTGSRWKQFTRTDGPWSWLLCIFLLTSFLIVYGCASTYGILFPGVLKELRSGKAITAIPGSLSLANSGILGPLTGRFYDRFGCTKGMLLGGLISVVGLFTSSFAPNSVVLILTFGMIFGSGLSLVYLSCLLVIPQYFKKFAFQATSLVSVGPGAALLVMSPVVQRLFQAFGWRKTMKVMSGLAFSPCIIGLAMSVIKGHEKPTRYSHSERNHGSDLEPVNTGCNRLIDLSVFKNKVYVLTAVMVPITSLGHIMPFVHVAKYCEDIGIPGDHSSWIYFSIGLSSLLSRLLVGKYGKTGLLTLPHMYQLGAYILAIGNLLLPVLKEFYLLIMYGIVNGVGEGLVFTACMHMVLDCLPASRGKGAGYGIYVFFVSLSYAAGPPLSGLVADVTGSYNYSFYTAGTLEIVGASLQFLSRFLHKSNNENEIKHSFDEKLIIIEKETVL